METLAHRTLKRLALQYLRDRGCLAAAMEVRCPIGKYRVDVAGYLDTAMDDERGWRSRCTPTTFLIECKQARGDFLRDDASTQRLIAKREQLARIRRSIEQHRIPEEEPELRRNGSSLFPELDDWDYTASNLPAYRKVIDKMERLDARLHGHTKFHKLSQWRLADVMLLAAPQGLIRHAEIPPGWGLLECPPAWLDGEANDDRLDERPTMSVVVDPKPMEATDQHRQRLLRNIAVKASLRSYGDGKR